MTVTAAEVKGWAREIGFAACGVTDLAADPHGERLDAWLSAGYAGTMRYLHRQARKRKDPRLIVPEARSAIVVLDNYYSAADRRRRPRVARYARGVDYHAVLDARLGRLAARLLEHGARTARRYADAGPVPERELARRAGLGWIGKNTMLIRPRSGSFSFIGTVFTDLVLETDRPFTTDHCGSCTRCLDACPTGAFVAPRVLDATRCISYLTIEQKGPIPEDLAGRLDDWAFGCDVCNEVCPWNLRFAEETGVPEYRARDLLDDSGSNPFETMTGAEFARRFAGTAFLRPGLSGMRRNWRAALRATPG